MLRFNVRQVAAVDMAGRARLITTEFLLGIVVCAGVGWRTAAISDLWFVQLLGYWMIAVGVNYIPLAAHAIDLLRPGRLEAELSGLDLRAERIHYTKAQFVVFVPLFVAVLALVELRKAGRPSARRDG